MGKVIFTPRNSNDTYEFSSTRYNELDVVLAKNTKKIKKVRTTYTPPFKADRLKGTLSLEVAVSSTETEDTQLLHQLYKLST